MAVSGSGRSWLLAMALVALGGVLLVIVLFFLVMLHDRLFADEQATEVETATASSRRAVREPRAHGAPAADAGVAVKSYGGRISGIVRWDDGTPAPGVYVGASHEGSPGMMVSTARDGTYRLERLPSGRLQVTATRRSQPASSTSREAPGSKTVELAPREHRTDLDFVLPKPSERIGGRIVGLDGRPAAGVIVAAAAEGAASEARLPVCGLSLRADSRTKSRADGTFEVEGIPRGSYSVGADDAQSRSFGVVRGVASGEMSVRLELKRSPTLAGTVADEAGNPVKRFSLDIRRSLSSSDQTDFCVRRGAGGLSMVSEGGSVGYSADGSDAFDLWGLGPGRFGVSVKAADGRRSGLHEVTLGEAEDQRGLRIVVIGNVEDVENETVTLVGFTVDGRSRVALPGVRIHCIGKECPVGVSSDAQGEFAFKAFTPGTKVTLVLSHPTSGMRASKDVTVPRTPMTLDLGMIELTRR